MVELGEQLNIKLLTEPRVSTAVAIAARVLLAFGTHALGVVYKFRFQKSSSMRYTWLRSATMPCFCMG